MPFLSIRVTDEEYGEVREHADQLGITLSEACRVRLFGRKFKRSVRRYNFVSNAQTDVRKKVRK